MTVLAAQPGSFGLANFKWIPAEKAILKELNSTRVMNPCLRSCNPMFFTFGFTVNFPIKYSVNDIVSSTKSIMSIMLQLLRKLEDKFIYFSLVSYKDDQLIKLMFRPLKVLKLTRGAKYILRKSCDDRVKKESCNTPKSSRPTILQLRRDNTRITQLQICVTSIIY